ncbi:MAG: enoyl-CoA hydratase/isomerase family protein [Gammaproteobacteria bacterium AqS3]|nr:enoyl-CoA hydratase/isomerase family protein [Gammaproteobacteria bacterium AqS3]
MSEAQQDVIFSLDQGVGLITLNRPDSLNALSGEMQTLTIEQLQAWAHDPEVGCIAITGAGRGFCSGGDVSGMAAGGGGGGKSDSAPPTLETRINRQRSGQEFSRLLRSIPKVTLALVNGAAAGAGLGIALACDMRLASSKAKFTTAFAKVGFGGDYGITWGLVHTVGPARARELLFLSDVYTADQALELGLVNRIYEAETFMDEALTLARQIAAGPQISYRWMKENVDMALQSGYHEMLDRESFTHLRCGETEDHREGVAAFLEKRAPEFKGR